MRLTQESQTLDSPLELLAGIAKSLKKLPMEPMVLSKVGLGQQIVERKWKLPHYSRVFGGGIVGNKGKLMMYCTNKLVARVQVCEVDLEGPCLTLRAQVPPKTCTTTSPNSQVLRYWLGAETRSLGSNLYMYTYPPSCIYNLFAAV